MASHVTILGAGPAGLAIGHYAKAAGLPFVIYERAGRWGGNCVTFEWNGFRYDSGAHRIHGGDGETLAVVSSLLPGALRSISSPSFIQTGHGRYIFPLELRNILTTMPARRLAAGLKDLAWSLLTQSGCDGNFEELAVGRYGSLFAREFLLNYTEKLWGRPCRQLDTSLAGKRLAGLHPFDMLKTFLPAGGRVRHMEGAFFYPEGGIGRLTDALAASCGHANIRLGQPVTRIVHDAGKIRAVGLDGGERVEVDAVVSTLPLDRFLRMLDPPVVPDRVPEGLRFRNLVLVALFLDRGSVLPAASAYFPMTDIPFTRAYEPRNRCGSMSPPGKTSLVVEIPCNRTDPVWQRPDPEVAQRVVDAFGRLDWFRGSEVLHFSVQRMEDAYPVLTIDCRRSLAEAERALRGIANLKLAGRNGRFSYSWIHNQVAWGRTIARELGA